MSDRADTEGIGKMRKEQPRGATLGSLRDRWRACARRKQAQAQPEFLWPWDSYSIESHSLRSLLQWPSVLWLPYPQREHQRNTRQRYAHQT